MISFEEIKRYLPQYLTAISEQELIAELKSFPDNIDGRFYTTALQDRPVIFQGDGLRDMLVVNLPDPKIAEARSMVISNTCDTNLENKRPYEAPICYAPIFTLSKYLEMLERRGFKIGEALDNHVRAIRAQIVTQIFFLPGSGGLEDDSIVFLNRLCHCSGDSIPRDGVPARRLFTLSNYGAYLLLLKLSIHFTRVTDQLDRSDAVSPLSLSS